MKARMLAIEIENVRHASSSGGNALAMFASTPYFLSVITCAMTSFMA
jgi:hypothetical protein